VVLTLINKAETTGLATAETGAGDAHREALLRELRDRKEMFERFFDSAPDAILVTDKSGRITDLNQQATRMFGYEREELVGKPIEILIPEHLQNEHHLHRERYFGSPRTRPMGQGLELYGRRKDGTQYPVDITLSPLRAHGDTRVLAAVRDITDHKVAEEKIRESLREKEVLLREVHHRVKNNLAVICSLFYLESTYAKDEHAAQVFRESENRVHSMALVHEILYGSKSLSHIDFSKYAKELATDILSSYGNGRHPTASVRLKSDLEPVIMSIDLAVPCGLILNELISNAFKHGFHDAREGEITLALLADSDGRCLLRVDDNGAGIPADLDVNCKKSLGLRLVGSLTQQIRGSFELVRTEPGTSARVQFPVIHHAN
jgi:PAS domain S-box-containing protein